MKLTLLSLSLVFLFLASPASADGGETVCTPVYGMANSCAEHAVVDTGLDTNTLTTAGFVSYALGLAAFIKAKRD